jgi:hypothetical protein
MDAGVRPRHGCPQAQEGGDQEGIRDGPCPVVQPVTLPLQFLNDRGDPGSYRQQQFFFICTSYYVPVFLLRQ